MNKGTGLARCFIQGIERKTRERGRGKKPGREGEERNQGEEGGERRDGRRPCPKIWPGFKPI